MDMEVFDQLMEELIGLWDALEKDRRVSLAYWTHDHTLDDSEFAKLTYHMRTISNQIQAVKIIRENVEEILNELDGKHDTQKAVTHMVMRTLEELLERLQRNKELEEMLDMLETVFSKWED